MPPTSGYQQGFRRAEIRQAIDSGACTVRAIALRLGLTRATTAAHLARMRADDEVVQFRPHGARAATWAVRR